MTRRNAFWLMVAFLLGWLTGFLHGVIRSNQLRDELPPVD
jgi:hypothetical protein